MRLERVTLDGAWLAVVLDILNGMTLSADNFQDKICLRFRMEPIGIWNRCGSCGAKLAVDHALQCKKVRLIVAHHNDMADQWGVMCSRPIPQICSSQTINQLWWVVFCGEGEGPRVDQSGRRVGRRKIGDGGGFGMACICWIWGGPGGDSNGC